MELFEFAADALTRLVAIDGGFFIYRKRGIETGAEPQAPALYHVFGAFADCAEMAPIEALVKEDLTLGVPLERWMLVEDVPHEALRAWLESQSVLEFGVWPLYSREEIRGAVVVARTRPVMHLTWETSHALMEACAAQISLALDMIMALRVAEHASQRDLLTGAWNRLGIERRWPRVLDRLRGDPRRYAILGILDVDHFKQINDTYGHPFGDRVLRLVAQTLRDQTTPDELVGRIGGDEFIVVAWTDAPDWRPRLFDMQNEIDSRLNGACGVSVGGSVLGLDGDTFDDCYTIADERLYENKRLRKQNFENPVG
ncbi:GGDEF domain-containing protein [Alicyclobacillus vulcanalis]|uniref:Diguanylate cyclase (GGDEF) domain-containing protein n=1 Tax=Alicyclobacillus vulcanalis TaxID=252246 RepID=A0A1N7NH86_9BACL|nr:GGDEF domain-containing protein [Alicyclobacillus vulcanalis]SIS97745.1 diguanylate cyclase (GGDEF) domain-containing protein [Alicyclobacillus vulcanalis]